LTPVEYRRILRPVFSRDPEDIMAPRAQHGPTDSVLSKLYAATGGSRYAASVKQEFLFWLGQVSKRGHRSFFASTFEKIERAGDSRIELDKIKGEIDEFVDREFLGRGKAG
jgi:hypothetical protein